MILETIAIRKVWAALKEVPWFVWVAIAVAALWFIDRNAQYREGFENGRGEVLEELRAAQAKAAETALKAAAQADEKALERAEAEAEVMRVAATHEAGWEKIMAQGSQDSWKDEAWTICFIAIVVACFLPWTQPYVAEGFAALEQTPDWFQWAMYASIGASFGIRGIKGFRK